MTTQSQLLVLPPLIEADLQSLAAHYASYVPLCVAAGQAAGDAPGERVNLSLAIGPSRLAALIAQRLVGLGLDAIFEGGWRAGSIDASWVTKLNADITARVVD